MSTPFLLAPMAELSHRALRELIEGFRPPDGAESRPGRPAEYFTEMISAGGLIAGGPFEEWYLDGGPRPEKLVYQIAGGDEAQLLEAVILLNQRDCLGIDINMGCSAPAITRTGAGVRWMADIDRAGTLVRRLRPHTSRRLSVKLRTGITDDFGYLVRFCRRLEDEGIDFITLHPRTAGEKFKRTARWDYVTALRKELRVPLAGNGDISSADEMTRRGNDCDAVMIGRLAVRCPWVFAEAAQASREPRAEAMPAAAAREKARTTVAREVPTAALAERAPAPDGGATSAERAPALDGGAPPAERAPAPDGGAPPAEQPAAPCARPDLEETGLRFLELLSRYQPPEFHLSRARRFFGYFCGNLKWGNYVKNLLNRETDLAGIERVWRRYFAEEYERRPPESP